MTRSFLGCGFRFFAAISIFSLVGFASPVLGARIPMTAERWQGPSGKVEFGEHKGAQALRVLHGSEQVVLKEGEFANGTIEFDVQPDQPDFVSLYFRRQNADENEIVYLRTWNAGKPTAPGTLQYAPTVKGVNLWDMLDHYQTACLIRSNEWNHVKIVVSGAQMRVFVNDPHTPVLEVPRLEGNTTTGGLAFQGSAYFANLEIRLDEVDGLPAGAGIDPSHTDARFLRHWQVSQPIPLPVGRELFRGDFPKAAGEWKAIEAERRGLINLTREFGKNESRRAVWLKLKIRAAAETKRRVELGFSDEVWVFLNGRSAYVDKNLYGQPIAKPPAGRCALENASFDLPLKAGDNELIVGVANDFYGWGVIARLDSLEGLELIVE